MKFLRIPILKNICERLFLHSSILHCSRRIRDIEKTKRTISTEWDKHTWHWHIQKFFRNTVLARDLAAGSQKGHNCDLWRIIFSYKHALIAWVGVVYSGNCNYYLLINCIRHCVKGEFIQNYFKIFSFLIWDKNLGPVPVRRQQNPSGFVPAWSIVKSNIFFELLLLYYSSWFQHLQTLFLGSYCSLRMHLPYGNTLYIQGWVHDFLNGINAGVYHHFLFFL